jgi:hypothetical protein
VAGIASSAQLDFVRDADGTARLRAALHAAAERYGVGELAHALGLDPTTLRNQIDYRKRTDKGGGFWKPSFDCHIKLWLFDRRYREECLSATDEHLADDETLSPEQALRDVQAMALSGEFGNAGRERIVALVRKVKKGGGR